MGRWLGGWGWVGRVSLVELKNAFLFYVMFDEAIDFVSKRGYASRYLNQKN